MPFTYALNPNIITVGPFAIRWYGLVYVLGFLLAYWVLRRFAKTGAIKNLDEEGVEEFIVWLIIFSIACARLAYVLIYNPAYYLATPWKVIAVWEGGLSFHGGLLGGILATLFFSRKKSISFYKLTDLLVVPFSLVLVFGRIANFVNGELVGTVTNVPWCVNYPLLEGCRHPSQFYEAATNLVEFAVLLPLYWRGTLRKKVRDGTVFWLFFVLYGLLRFLVNFWRAPDPTDPLFLGLLLGQWLSLVMVIVGGVMLIKFSTTTSGETVAVTAAERPFRRRSMRRL